jgi:hypothetical protein
MPDRFPPGTPALSADSIRENTRAKAVRASFEFWTTGNEALLEQAFAETFAEHAAPPCEPCGQSAALGRCKRTQNEHPQKDLPENQRLAPEPRGGAGMVSVP